MLRRKKNRILRRFRYLKSQAAQQSPDPTPEKTPAELYEEKFGKPPHHRMKPETILEKLKEA